MRSRTRAWALPLAAFAIHQGMHAQSARGTIAGTVTDAQGRALQGAQVMVSPGELRAVSDAQGQYRFAALAAGTYSVTVTYSGFAPATSQVTLAAGETQRADESLAVASASEGVEVYAGREGGEVEAVNRTLSADNLINVLPSDIIRSLPNANVADALGRLPGVTLERDEGEGKYVQIRGTEPRLTNIMIDGVNIASAETVRQVKLDLIPANLVSAVVINKTLQANMPGDGIGGSVDLQTKTAGSKPTLQLEGLGGYDPILGGRDNWQVDGTIGQRFLNDRFGAIGTASFDYNGRGIHDVEPGPFLLGGYDARLYQYYRRRFGVAGSLDYRLSDTSSLYLKGLYSLFHNFGNRWDYNQTTSFDANAQPVAGSGAVSFGAEIRRPIQDVGSIQLGGHHVIRRSVFNWDVESSLGRTRDNGYDDASFSNQNSYSFAADVSNPLVPKLTAVGANIFDPTQYYLSSLRINNYYNPEVDLGLGGSLGTSYKLAGHESTIEIGGRFRNVHKFANQDTRFYIPRLFLAAYQNPALQMTNFLGNFTDPNYYGGNYSFGPTADFNSILQLPSGFTQDQSRTNQTGNNFNYIEKVSSAYAMNTINLGRFRIVAGLRFEQTNNHDGAAATGTNAALAKDGSYLSILPSASVRYALTPAAGLRLVYGRGLSRPNFSDLVSFATIAPGGVRTTSSIGNPNLKPEYANNLDLLYEHSLPHVGLLQGGVYYKNLSNPILPIQTRQADGTFLTQPQNAGSAYVYGFEAAFQQHFTYLPGLLSGLGLSANYGYSASQVTFPGPLLADGVTPSGITRSDKPNLLRQAPNTWNVSPTYDKHRISARLGLSYNAANIFAYNYSDSNAGTFDPTSGSGGGIKGPNGDLYLYAHLQVDLQGTYDLGKGFQAVAYGLNLNNEVFGFYQGSTIYPIQREFYRQTYGGGLRWSR